MDLNNLSEADVQGAFTDTAHPLHAKYASGDRATVDAVTRALERAHPGQATFGEDAGIAQAIRRWEAKHPQAAQVSAPGDSTAEDQAAIAFQATLRADQDFGGANFDANMEAARAAHVQLFGDRAQEVAELVDSSFSEAEKFRRLNF